MWGQVRDGVVRFLFVSCCSLSQGGAVHRVLPQPHRTRARGCSLRLCFVCVAALQLRLRVLCVEQAIRCEAYG